MTLPSETDNLLEVVNIVRANKQLSPLTAIAPEDRLRQELEFDSLDLAELTVRLEEHFGVDVFADGLVYTVGEVRSRLGQTDPL